MSLLFRIAGWCFVAAITYIGYLIVAGRVEAYKAKQQQGPTRVIFPEQPSCRRGYVPLVTYDNNVACVQGYALPNNFQQQVLENQKKIPLPVPRPKN